MTFAERPDEHFLWDDVIIPRTQCHPRFHMPTPDQMSTLIPYANPRTRFQPRFHMSIPAPIVNPDFISQSQDQMSPPIPYLNPRTKCQPRFHLSTPAPNANSESISLPWSKFSWLVSSTQPRSAVRGEAGGLRQVRGVRASPENAGRGGPVRPGGVI